MEGDPIRIRQIISNLLSNAIKFTAKGSVVLGYEVTHEASKYTLHIIVSDQGCGIPEADKNKLFNEFTRVAGSEGADGFGLDECHRRTHRRTGGARHLAGARGAGGGRTGLAGRRHHRPGFASASSRLNP